MRSGNLIHVSFFSFRFFPGIFFFPRSNHKQTMFENKWKGKKQQVVTRKCRKKKKQNKKTPWKNKNKLKSDKRQSLEEEKGRTVTVSWSSVRGSTIKTGGTNKPNGWLFGPIFIYAANVCIVALSVHVWVYASCGARKSVLQIRSALKICLHKLIGTVEVSTMRQCAFEQKIKMKMKWDENAKSGIVYGM